MSKTNRRSKERMNVLSVRNKGRNKERMNAFKEKNKRRGNVFSRRNKKRSMVKLLLVACGSPVYIKLLKRSCPGWTSS